MLLAYMGQYETKTNLYRNSIVAAIGLTAAKKGLTFDGIKEIHILQYCVNGASLSNLVVRPLDGSHGDRQISITRFRPREHRSDNGFRMLRRDQQPERCRQPHGVRRFCRLSFSSLCLPVFARISVPAGGKRNKETEEGGS